MASRKLQIVVYDACVLFPFHLRNVLVQCAVDRLVGARWTDDIHGEWIRNLLKRNTALSRVRLEATRDAMKRALPEADVTGYHHLIPALEIQDPDDRHVLAAAIHAKADAILSVDRDFSNTVVSRYGMSLWRPSDFLTSLFDADQDLMLDVLARARANLRQSTPTPEEFVAGLRACGHLNGFCDLISGHLGRL